MRHRLPGVVATAKSIFAVAWRDIRITTRYKTWFVASFIWPIIFPFSLVFIGRGLAGPSGEGVEHFASLAHTADYASFIIVGSLVWMFVNINLWMGGLSLMTDRNRGTFDTHWTMPVSKLALVAGATIASLGLNFLPMVVAVGFYSAIGWLQVSGDAVQILLAILAVLPNAVQSIGWAIPLTHFIELIRAVVIQGDRIWDHSGSLAFLVGSGAAMLAAGAYAFRLARSSVRRTGLVTGY